MREYVACMDKVSQIYSIYEHELEFLEKLRKDCKFLEIKPQADMTKLHNGDGNTGKSTTEQTDWAADQRRSSHEGLPRTYNDLRNLLDDVSSKLQSYLATRYRLMASALQPRTIEQNELAIVAEPNNKAIIVFQS